MRKILIVSTVNFDFNGITQVIMNFYRALDKSDLKIDFVVYNQMIDTLKDEIESTDSNIFVLPNRKKQTIEYMKELKKIMLRGYDVIHVHGNSATMQLELWMAKQIGITNRIAHCHNSSCSHKAINQILKPFFNKTYTHAIACSNLAGKWLFGSSKFVVLNNAINLNEFRFCRYIRDMYRQQFHLEDKFVIGNIGHFSLQKNHMFLLEVFARIHKIKQNAILLLISDGNLRIEIEHKIKSLGLQDDVILLGKRDDVAQLLQAMDVFVLPSRWEGLGMVLIEAQATGLPCVASTAVPEEAKVTELLEYISLDDSQDYWAEKILTVPSIDRQESCNEYINKIRKNHYDINDTVSQLRDIYLT